MFVSSIHPVAKQAARCGLLVQVAPAYLHKFVLSLLSSLRVCIISPLRTMLEATPPIAIAFCVQVCSEQCIQELPRAGPADQVQ